MTRRARLHNLRGFSGRVFRSSCQGFPCRWGGAGRQSRQSRCSGASWPRPFVRTFRVVVLVAVSVSVARVSWYLYLGSATWGNMLRFYWRRRKGSVYFVLLCSTLLWLLIEILCRWPPPGFTRIFPRSPGLAGLPAADYPQFGLMVITRGQKRLGLVFERKWVNLIIYLIVF